MVSSILLDRDHKIRNGWWIAVFFLILSAFLFPLIFAAEFFDFEIALWHQLIIIIAASTICQLWSKKPLRDLVGVITGRWFTQLCIGLGFGAVLMIVPAIILLSFGAVNFIPREITISSVGSTTLVVATAVLAEELLFRGFIFQRLIKGLGPWPAQIIIGILFLLTHMNNPGMTASTKLLASINIFFVSILFGVAYLKTDALAMPLGIHFMANFVQGVILGFGVSGETHTSFLRPSFNAQSIWLTGGDFGLEASAPGLLCVLLLCAVLTFMKRKNWCAKAWTN